MYLMLKKVKRKGFFFGGGRWEVILGVSGKGITEKQS